MSEENIGCDCNVIHHDIVCMVEENLPNEDKLYDLAELFKVFGDSTRIRILSALSVHEMCVCDIASLLNMTKSSISHQLRILKTAKLVRSRKAGNRCTIRCPTTMLRKSCRRDLTMWRNERYGKDKQEIYFRGA